MAKSVKVHSKARELMREYVGDIYADVRAAKAAGEPVGYSTLNSSAVCVCARAPSSFNF